MSNFPKRLSEKRHIMSPHYQALESGRSEIRLLNIVRLPNSNGNTSCQIQTVSLDDNPRYVALSYVWENPNVTNDIVLEGKKHPVTTNLWSALSHIASCFDSELDRLGENLGNHGGTSPTLFWIDALCINQKDTTERSHQVQLMQRIYQSATLVLSWLGDMETLESGILSGIEAMELIAGKVAVNPGCITNVDWMEEYPQLWKKDCTVGSENISWNAITAIMQREYWCRV
jgi:hypothetical protein